jgi:hypothetical protein
MTTVYGTKEEEELPKKRIKLSEIRDLFLNFYALMVMIYIISMSNDNHKNSFFMQYPKFVIYNSLVFWVNVGICQLITLTPIIVLRLMHTSKDIYPVTKGEYGYSIMKHFLAASYFPTIIINTTNFCFVSFSYFHYCYYNYNIQKDITETAILVSVLCALFVGRKLFKRPFVRAQNWFYDLPVIWKFMVTQIGARREIGNSTL